MADPSEEALRALGLTRWPGQAEESGSCSSGSGGGSSTVSGGGSGGGASGGGGKAERRDGRLARSFTDFSRERRRVNARLIVAGEQALSLMEFFSLRLYTGPMFVKYNAVLRGASSGAVEFFARAFADLCLGNRYALTLQVCSASILKLGKISKATMVYRAPGGALPDSFWMPNFEGV